MNNIKKVMHYKKSNKWIADLFVMTNNTTELSYELSCRITVDQYGNVRKSFFETSLFVTTIMQQDIDALLDELGCFMWNDLSINHYWFRYRQEGCDKYHVEYFMYIINFLKVDLPYKIREKLLSFSNSEELFNYISNYNTDVSILSALNNYSKCDIGYARAYNPKTDIIICRSFDDSSVIISLLACCYKYTMFCDIDIDNAIEFLKWLQQHYPVDDIVDFISRKGHTEPIFFRVMEIAQLVSSVAPVTYQKCFKKSNTSINYLYDDLVTMCKKMRTYEKKVDRSNMSIDTSPVMTPEDLELIIPTDRVLLINSSEQLSICLFGFSDGRYESVNFFEYDKEQYIEKAYTIGVYKNNCLWFAMRPGLGELFTSDKLYEDTESNLNYTFDEIDEIEEQVLYWLESFSSLFLEDS